MSSDELEAQVNKFLRAYLSRLQTLKSLIPYEILRDMPSFKLMEWGPHVIAQAYVDKVGKLAIVVKREARGKSRRRIVSKLKSVESIEAELFDVEKGNPIIAIGGRNTAIKSIVFAEKRDFESYRDLLIGRTVLIAEFSNAIPVMVNNSEADVRLISCVWIHNGESRYFNLLWMFGSVDYFTNSFGTDTAYKLAEEDFYSEIGNTILTELVDYIRKGVSIEFLERIVGKRLVQELVHFYSQLCRDLELVLRDPTKDEYYFRNEALLKYRYFLIPEIIELEPEPYLGTCIDEKGRRQRADLRVVTKNGEVYYIELKRPCHEDASYLKRQLEEALQKIEKCYRYVPPEENAKFVILGGLRRCRGTEVQHLLNGFGKMVRERALRLGVDIKFWTWDVLIDSIRKLIHVLSRNQKG